MVPNRLPCRGGFAGDTVGNESVWTQQPLFTSLPTIACGKPAQDVDWAKGPDRTAKDQEIDLASDRVGPGAIWPFRLIHNYSPGASGLDKLLNNMSFGHPGAVRPWHRQKL